MAVTSTYVPQPLILSQPLESLEGRRFDPLYYFSNFGGYIDWREGNERGRKMPILRMKDHRSTVGLIDLLIIRNDDKKGRDHK